MAKKPRTTGTTTLPTQALVTRQFRSGGKDVGEPEQIEEVLEIHRFVTTPAQVKLALGKTINLGNYEFLRVDVSLTVPCYKEEADAAFEYAQAWVEDRTLKEAESAKKIVDGCEPDDPF